MRRSDIPEPLTDVRLWPSVDPGALEPPRRAIYQQREQAIHAYLLGDFVVVRLQGLLTPAERQLAKVPSEKGRDLLKQVRTQLIESARPIMQGMVEQATGVKVVSMHHDISTSTGHGRMLLN